MSIRVQDPALQEDAPRRFRFIPWRFWQLVYRPRTTTATLRERHGDMAGWEFGGVRYFMGLTPEGARQVLLADPDGYQAFWKEGFTGLMGPGSLWVLDGNRHRRERQLLGPAFHSHAFSAYGETIRQITRARTDQWHPGRTIRVLDTTMSISLEVILRLVFAVPEEALQEGRRVLADLLGSIKPSIVFFTGLQRPWFPVWRRYARASAKAVLWADRLMETRRAQAGEAQDVLGRLLAARYEDGTSMNDADIRSEMFTVLSAGHETTATALAWALYELGRHPVVLAKLREDLAHLGPDPDPTAVVKVPYLSAVCDETLRLHTLLAEVARVAAMPMRICGHSLRPGDAAIVSIIAIHHDPALYPDPDAFIPERFIEHSYTPLEFLPFGGGHRHCLGAALSDFEMRIALAEIVMHWDFEPAAVEHDIRHDIAMGPKRGVRLHIKGRWETPQKGRRG